jgi:hypothetical protein
VNKRMLGEYDVDVAYAFPGGSVETKVMFADV